MIELVEAQLLGAAQLVRAVELRPLDCKGESDGDVLDPDRLRERPPVAEHRDDRRPAVHAGERADGHVLGSVDHGRPEDGGRDPGAAYQLLGLPLGAVVARSAGLRPGAHRAHVDEPPHSGGCGGSEQAPRSLDVHGGERGGPPLRDDPDEVDDGLDALEQGGEGGAVSEIARQDLHAPGGEGTRRAGTPRQGPDAVSAA